MAKITKETNIITKEGINLLETKKNSFRKQKKSFSL